MGIAGRTERVYSTPYIAGRPIEVGDEELTDVIRPADQRPLAKVLMAQEWHFTI